MCQKPQSHNGSKRIWRNARRMPLNKDSYERIPDIRSNMSSTCQMDKYWSMDGQSPCNNSLLQCPNPITQTPARQRAHGDANDPQQPTKKPGLPGFFMC